jgi:anti-anti-sigma regulatory factor
MRLRPADTFGNVLVSRARASALRETIDAALQRGEDVVVDFEGVTALSPSFVDELFAKAGGGSPDHLVFVNVPPSIEPLIRFVRSSRRPPPIAA